MARKTVYWTAPADCGRDAGKRFLLTEMPSDQGERWALRLLLALANGGTKLPEGTLEMGMAGVASIAGACVLALKHLQGLRWEDAEPLLEEMMECVKFAPDITSAGGTEIPPRALMVGANSQIEEIATRLKLKWEVFHLHVDFLQGGGLSISALAPAAPPSPSP